MTRFPNRRSIVPILLTCIWIGALRGGGPVSWDQLTPRGTDGKVVLLEPAKWTVVCFLGTECPLARLYGPRLQALADQSAERGVRFLGVNSNAQDSPAEIDAFARQHQIHFTMIKDADQSIADALGASRTPEVFVLDAAGWIRYQGRIDDQYEPGVTRAKPTRSELKEALEALSAGKPVSDPKTTAVGCLITRVKRSEGFDDSGDDVTFTRDIAPILNAHCVECHRQGTIGPMELTQYDEVVGWGQMILEVIDQGRMPPWHADPAIGHFVGERRMPAETRETIAAWLENGMPEGDPSDLPTPPAWPQEWQFATEPDAEFAMRNRPFTVPADDVVEYQYFVVDPKWNEDRWIHAAQVIPGAPSVVHHCIVFIRPPDGDRFQGTGWLAAYVPGQRAVGLPDGHARRVPAGSKLVFQMHYTPCGRETTDVTRIGVWEIDAAEVTHEVSTQLAIDHEFEIPPGAKEHHVMMSVDSFPADGRMLGITPHMHLRGKSFKLDAVGADGDTETLLHVPRYDFNWQHWYEFAKPVELDPLDALQMTVTFDNSASNPFNPAPNDFVSWGDQTWEEMAIAFFDVAVPRTGSAQRRSRPPLVSEQELAARKDQVDAHVEAFLSAMDANRDGVVDREECPVAFRRYGFKQFDRNRDGRIDVNEIEAGATKRL